MAAIRERNGKYCVIFSYTNEQGERKQKWETFPTKSEALKRKKELEYKMQIGKMQIPECHYMRELLSEYVELYGKDKWALSTYDSNVALIGNYILPVIGDVKLQEINTRFIEQFYQKLLKMPPVQGPYTGKAGKEFIGAATVQDIHKLLHSCFEQALKWELVKKNPTEYAIVPKYKSKKREIWTAETLMHALEVCEDECLKLAINLAFAGSLRIGELLALTWDCVDISEAAIQGNRAYIYINKELQRVKKESVEELNKKDILFIFPENSKVCKTVRVLKTPKTESSIRKVFLPRSVAESLIAWKKEQDETKDILGDEYQNYDLVMASSSGMPQSGSKIRKALKRLIEEQGLPPVVFHSLRHSSVTYKLKLNGGDIKSVQGDSGHAQVNMVTDVYSHIIDEDRRKNAELFEEAFYGKKNLDPAIHGDVGRRTIPVPEGVDVEMLMKVLSNPEMAALLSSLMKTMPQ